jgi:uncharacterized cupredoxin-like copper-binding protein/glucose/arabinose dehydrogenase
MTSRVFVSSLLHIVRALAGSPSWCGAPVVAFGLAVVAASSGVAQNPSAIERFVGPSAERVERESRSWRRTSLPVPEGIVLEVSGILPVAGERLLVCTRRGEIWWVDGAYEPEPRPRYSRFAEGLHEPLGLAAAPGGGVYVAQRQEVTLIEDQDGDGRADSYRTVFTFPISGSYHEYAFGPVVAPDGTMRVTLNVAFGGATQSPVPWRGWMLEITPDGRMTPIAAGLRSPADLFRTSKGLWLFSDNQGEWVGSGRVTEVQSGDFVGHPAGLAWAHLPGSPVTLRPSDVVAAGEPMHTLVAKMPGLKPPTVWLPHTVLGISNAGIFEDVSAGAFGPYAGHLFVGDQGQSKIIRLTLEQVRGVWQGAAYAFREGFESGILRLRQGERGVVFAGETARGWGSVGPKQYGLERLEWTGHVPFDVQEVTAQPDGFLIRFTQPVDRESAAQTASYVLAGFTYKYNGAYGSPPIDRMACPVQRVEVAADGLSVRIAAHCLREGYIHELKLPGIRSAGGGEPILHPTVYYTLNRIPEGARIIPADPKKEAEWCVAAVPTNANAPSPKRPTRPGPTWKVWEGDRQLLLSTKPGLKFDHDLLTAKAGEKVLLVFRNDDDMLHNFVLCAPGRGNAVGEAALKLGVEAAERSYVPTTEDVIVHTAILEPGATDRIFFEAPSQPGDYEYICSFPGHSTLMRGILRVLPRE